jgi:hypothetical protein
VWGTYDEAIAIAQLTGAVFHYDYDDKQLLGSKFVGLPFGTLPVLVNIPRSSINGQHFTPQRFRRQAPAGNRSG